MTTLKVRFRPSPTDDGDAARHTSRTVQTACPPPPLPCRDGEGTDSFLTFARATISHLRGIGRERLAETYTSSVNSFMRFRGGRGDVAMGEMDGGMMAAYEAYLRRTGVVANTSSFYMRNLRAIYNRAVECGLTADRAPFRHVYTGIGRTAKRAVPPIVISRIKALDLPPQSPLGQARDLFMFSFYTRGMSFIDMAYLQKKDLRDGILAYRRQKTDQQLFIKWEQPMQDIIDRPPHARLALSAAHHHGDGRRAAKAIPQRHPPHQLAPQGHRPPRQIARHAQHLRRAPRLGEHSQEPQRAAGRHQRSDGARQREHHAHLSRHARQHARR